VLLSTIQSVIAAILIGVPVAILFVIGLAYVFVPGHLSYYQRVIEKLGGDYLKLKLHDLQMICAYAMITTISATGLVHLDEDLPWGSFFTVAGISIVASIISYQKWFDSAMARRRWSGIFMIGFFVELVYLAFDEPNNAYIGGFCLSLALAYTAFASRALGRKAEAKTPWPILAALATSSALGSILMLLKI